jgi:hypothetical protein
MRPVVLFTALTLLALPLDASARHPRPPGSPHPHHRFSYPYRTLGYYRLLPRSGYLPRVVEPSVVGVPAAAPVWAGPGDGADLTLEPEQMLNLLADPLMSVDGKRDLAEEIIGGGTDAIPMLIAHLGDPRPYRLRPTDDAVPLGAACESMLVRIVSPVGLPGTPLNITDWGAWWAKNRDKPLEQIQDELERAAH